MEWLDSYVKLEIYPKVQDLLDSLETVGGVGEGELMRLAPDLAKLYDGILGWLSGYYYNWEIIASPSND